eukprot:1160911-Pelagomonas_calceolata.AAC.1
MAQLWVRVVGEHVCTCCQEDCAGLGDFSTACDKELQNQNKETSVCVCAAGLVGACDNEYDEGNKASRGETSAWPDAGTCDSRPKEWAGWTF